MPDQWYKPSYATEAKASHCLNLVISLVAPEILNKETVNEATDMWGLGALTYVMSVSFLLLFVFTCFSLSRLSGVSPFFGDNPQITRFHIKEGHYDYNAAAFEQVSQDAKDFIRSLLQLHPQ